MIHLTANTTILLATHCVDFRKQIDGLVALVQGQLDHDPRDGAMYVFINRGKFPLRSNSAHVTGVIWFKS